jgi:hypothetical protein
MYRIQAYNYVKKYFVSRECSSSDRAAVIQQLLDTGEYVEAGISCEWLARCD